MDCKNCVFNIKDDQRVCSYCSSMEFFADKEITTEEKIKDVYVNKVCNLKYLKTKIKPVDRKLLDPTGNQDMMENLIFPKTYYNDLKYLANLYGAKVKLRKPYSDGRHGFFYRSTSRRIFITTDHNGYLDTWSVCTIFLHELAHAIQHSVMLEHGFQAYLPIKLSESITFERTAERLAYFLYKEYLSHIHSEFITHRSYSSYIRKEDKLFLYNFKKKNKYPVIDDLGVTHG